ncbi:MAG: M20/M25/M40 family metallo-hydrolase [Gemmatimonadota bacterium]|nr:M20/M25/M40 family metallo-hydrolase [Gemmatimonadota bacterium]
MRYPYVPTILAVAALSTYVTSLSAQTAATAETAAVERVTSDLRFLAEDAREGRGVGTEGLDQAAEYVAQSFRAAGLEPGGPDGFFQYFEISPSAPGAAHTNLGGSRVRNVIGVLPGRGPLAGQVVVVGAHYDHLGYGIAQFSLDPDSVQVIHNGADDNASGTAALLEIARLLGARNDANRRTIAFVAFTAEELGTIGSQYYAEHPVLPHDSTYAMLNFDMVGRLRGDSLVVIGAASAEELQQIVESVNTDFAMSLAWQSDPWGRSDHSSFYAKQIPVVHFFTDLHEDYHRTTDDWDKINTAGIARIADFAANLATDLATRSAPLTYVDVPRPTPPAAQAGRRRASLGTIPDMTDSPGGVRLSGVRAGTAADEAGLQAGDILIQIGEHEVKNLNDMQTALMAYQAGDTVLLVVLREGERIEANATLK